MIKCVSYSFLLWLAWDCGLTLNLKKPFMETPAQQKVRLHQNAMILTLAQIIDDDEVVIDEAKQSIGSLTTSEMDWLKEIQRIAQQCDSMKQDGSTLEPATGAVPGDIAVHKTQKDLALRVVSHRGSGQVVLIKLNKDKDSIAYKADHMAVSKLTSGIR